MKRVKSAELAVVDGRVGLKVYLYRDCAAILRRQAEKHGGVLRKMRLNDLCPECRAEAMKGLP